MKLQDSLGEKLPPGGLSLTQDPLPPEAPFAQKLLNRRLCRALLQACLFAASRCANSA